MILFFFFKHTLTGHSGKVMAAKYVQEPIKVVTGSHDRTLKIWDLRSIACIETKFAGSSCNDLCTTDSLGSTIISGHYDKKIRFWDIRTEKQADDVLMPAKITSLDLSKGKCVLAHTAYRKLMPAFASSPFAHRLQLPDMFR